MSSKSKTKYELLAEAAGWTSGGHRNVCISCGFRWKTLDELLSHRCTTYASKKKLEPGGG